MNKLNTIKIINPPHLFWKPLGYFMASAIISFIIIFRLFFIFQIDFSLGLSLKNIIFIISGILIFLISNFFLLTEPVVIVLHNKILVKYWIVYILRLQYADIYPKHDLSETNVKAIASTDGGSISAHRKYKFPWYQKPTLAGLQLHRPEPITTDNDKIGSFHLEKTKPDHIIVFNFLTLKDLLIQIKLINS